MTANGRNGKNGKNGKNGRNGARQRKRPLAVNNRQRRRRRNRRRRDRAQSRRFVLVSILAIVLGGAGSSRRRRVHRRAGLHEQLLARIAAGRSRSARTRSSTRPTARCSVPIPAEQNRQPVALDQMSPLLAQATVAIEDRRFYSHSGIDYEGIVRAAVKNLQSGEIVQGGSTLTQQLVRNLYIGREVSWERKTKEACLAIKLEEEGLPQLWGARLPFRRRAEALAQGADPRDLPEPGVLRQPRVRGGGGGADVLLQARDDLKLVAGGADRRAAAGAVDLRPLQEARGGARAAQRRARGHARRRLHQRVGVPRRRRERAARAEAPGRSTRRSSEPFFFSYVRELLIDKYGATTRARRRAQGLHDHQPALPALADRVDAGRTLNQPDDPASAIVSINPQNGAIRAMTAVVPGQEEHPVQPRGAGPAPVGVVVQDLRPDRGDPPGDQPVHDATISRRRFHWQPDPNSEPWDVATYSHSYIGAVPIATATLSSDNTVYARLTLDVGPENVVRIARQMGIKTKLLPVASIGLGSNAVSVLEMASAYATLAAGGVYSEPMAIRKVVLADGAIDRTPAGASPSASASSPDGVAYEVTRILQSNIAGRHRRRRQLRRPVGGRQDGHDRRLGRRLVRRLHAAGVDGRLGRLPERADRDDERPRHHRRGRHLPGLDLAPLHVARPRRPAVSQLAVSEEPGVWVPFTGQYAFVGAPPQAREAGKGQEDRTGTTTGPPTTTEPRRRRLSRLRPRPVK